jgi:Ca2+-binding RTX toxin-like protein
LGVGYDGKNLNELAGFYRELTDGVEKVLLPVVGGDDSGTLFGTDGNDLLIGSLGDDLLVGGKDSDVLRGGAGDDTLFGGDGQDRLLGEAGNDVINGDGGDDAIYGGAGDDTIDGGAGTDKARFYGDRADYLIEYSDGPLVLTVTGPDGTDTLTNVEHLYFDDRTFIVIEGTSASEFNLVGGKEDNLILGRNGNDILKGGAGRDILDGGLGFELLYGGVGDDILYGGIGDNSGDLARFGGEYSEYTIQTGVDFLLVKGPEGNDFVKNIGFVQFDHDILNVQFGEDGGDTLIGHTDIPKWDAEGRDILIGQTGDDSISGLGGDDTLRGGSGNDVLDGGDGSDTAVFAGLAADYEVTFDGVETIVVTGPDGVDRLKNIEKLVFDDRSLDILIGTDGDDKLVLDSSPNGFILGLKGAGTLIGGDGGNYLDGGEGDDTLVGGDGDDILVGGLGANSLYGAKGTDIAVFSGAMADYALGFTELFPEVAVGEGASLTTVKFVEILKFSDAEMTVTFLQNDRVLGTVANPVRYLGDNQANLVKAYSGDVSKMFGRGGDDFLTGSVFADLINGGSGNDRLYGLGSFDKIIRGAGNDQIFGGHGRDTLLGSKGNDLIDGGDWGDLINGGSGKDLLFGGLSHDTLNGGGGNDTLVGGEGDDVLRGGGGKDVFVYISGESSGSDTIGDFNLAADILRFESLTESDLTISAAGGGSSTKIEFAGGAEILLRGVQLDDLTDVNYSFV